MTPPTPEQEEARVEVWTIYPQEWNGGGRARWIEGPRPRADHRKGLEVAPLAPAKRLAVLLLQMGDYEAVEEAKSFLNAVSPTPEDAG